MSRPRALRVRAILFYGMSHPGLGGCPMSDVLLPSHTRRGIFKLPLGGFQVL